MVGLLFFFTISPNPLNAENHPLLADDCKASGSCAEEKSREATRMTDEELRKKGEELKHEIVSIYKKMVHDQTLKSGQNILDNEIVQKFFPNGTSFEDTKKILDGAGFKTSIKNLITDTSGITGWMSLDEKPIFMTTVHVGIDAFPQVKNDFGSGVGKVGIAIFVSNL